MEDFAGTETLVIELLLIVSIVALVVRRFRMPYTVALVLAGLLISWQTAPEVRLTPELILLLFLPPLVFEAVIHINYRRLREDLLPIVLLAVPGVLISAAVVGAVLSYGAGIPLLAALAFGALISSTDPVAVVALFRSIGVPRRLMMLVEGESLFNDGASIVLFNVLVAAAISGAAAEPAGLLAAEAVIDFLRVAIGGIAIGASLGWIVSRIGARIDDYLVVTTVTTVLANWRGCRWHTSTSCSGAACAAPSGWRWRSACRQPLQPADWCKQWPSAWLCSRCWCKAPP